MSVVRERTFFEDQTVRITSTRAELGSKTFAIANIASVHTQRLPSPYPPFIFACALLALPTCGLTLLGLIPLVILWAVSPGLFAVQFDTASGAVTAYTASDPDYVERIAEAIEEAITSRG